MAERINYLEQSWVQEGDTVTLKGCTCSACGANFFPAREQCTECFSVDAMKPLDLPHTGNLYTYTILYRAAKGFPSPLAVGYVDFPEQNVRVFGQLEATATELSWLKPDTPVRVTTGIIKTENDTETWGYRFKPIFTKEEGDK